MLMAAAAVRPPAELPHRLRRPALVYPSCSRKYPWLGIAVIDPICISVRARLLPDTDPALAGCVPTDITCRSITMTAAVALCSHALAQARRCSFTRLC